MALAIDASSPAAVTMTGGSVQPTTASFTPPSGSLILVMYGVTDAIGGTDESLTSVTNTGTAITWTRRARKNRNAGSTGGASTQDGGAELWTGVGAGTAITVTASGVLGESKMLKVMVITGADTTSLANVAAQAVAGSLPSITLTGCLVGSHVFAISSDQAGQGLGTVGSGQTMIAEYNVSFNTQHSWRTTSTLASAGSQTMNLTAPALQTFNFVVLEVRASGGAASPNPRPIPRAYRAPHIRASVF